MAKLVMQPYYCESTDVIPFGWIAACPICGQELLRSDQNFRQTFRWHFEGVHDFSWAPIPHRLVPSEWLDELLEGYAMHLLSKIGV